MYRCSSLLIFIALFLSTPSFAASAYTVMLTNGNVLEANSYSVKNGKLYLQYPVGEAAIPLNQVVSIIGDDGSADLLQSKGKSIPHTDLKTSGTGNPGTNGTAATPKAFTRGKLQPRTPIPNTLNVMRERIEEKKAAVQKAVSRSRPVNAPLGDNSVYDPVAGALVEQLSTADEKQAEEISNQLNAIFDATNAANVVDKVSP